MIQNLILLEHDGEKLRRSTLSAVSLARQLGGSFAFLVIGGNVRSIAEAAVSFGAEKVLLADHPSLAEPIAERYADIVAAGASAIQATTILGTTSTFTKDVLPRVAAGLDAPMLTDVIGVESADGSTTFHCAISAGMLCAAMQLEAGTRVLTARGTAFEISSPNGSLSPIEALDFDFSSLPNRTTFVSRVRSASARPDLTEARVVVCGGRPLNNKETFERLIGGLADALGGAVGATRAAVDAGMAPNEWQVGQTGKVVAPELYFAVGVSGSIQHWAGIKDSKVIVAINRDPEAPIFQVANYGLVADLHQVLPELISSVKGRK